MMLTSCHMLLRLIQEEKDSAEQRAEELESQVGGVSMGGPSAGGQEASRWHTFGQMSPPGTDMPAVPSPAMHQRSNISQQKYLVVSKHFCVALCLYKHLSACTSVCYLVQPPISLYKHMLVCTGTCQFVLYKHLLACTSTRWLVGL